MKVLKGLGGMLARIEPDEYKLFNGVGVGGWSVGSEIRT